MGGKFQALLRALNSRQVRRLAAQAIILSLILQAYVLVTPLYMQLVLDEVVVDSNYDLLRMLAGAFAAFALFNAIALAMRSAFLQRLTNTISWEFSTHAFNHLIKLPLVWFQSRRLADTLGRLQGIDQIRAMIGNGVSSIIDGFLSATTLIMLFSKSPLLAAISLTGLATYIAIRLSFIPLLLRMSKAQAIASVEEQALRIESIRAIQAIKAMDGEALRERAWRSKLRNSLVAIGRNGNTTGYFQAIQTLAATLTSVAAVYWGARSVISGDLSIGMLSAALAYQTQFMRGSVNLFEQFIAWRMLDVPVGRLNDILRASPEVQSAAPNSDGSDHIKHGEMELRDVTFRYPGARDDVLKGIDLKIAAGEHVAIVGPSGTGKSTLLKVIAGLHAPQTGAVLFDGVSTSVWGLHRLRRAIGIVMQDDHLFAGTIAENVAFFESDADPAWVWECLSLSGLADDIKRFPDGVATNVSEDATNLSAGQKQRLFLARALFRRPSILLLDEATSNLDLPRERQIVVNLNKLKMTRIVVAHRSDTIAAADRSVRLVDGKCELDTK